jgi:hypothetical protein
MVAAVEPIEAEQTATSRRNVSGRVEPCGDLVVVDFKCSLEKR